MWIGTKAPHQPATPAPRDEKAYPDVTLPRRPTSTRRDVSDKPDWINDNPPLSGTEGLHGRAAPQTPAVHAGRGRHDRGSRKIPARIGELDNTYIFFTSDNGFHLGQHRLGAGKWTPYGEDIRCP